MSEAAPSFVARLFLAWVAYFRTIFDAEFARGVVRLREGALPAGEPAHKPEPKTAPAEPRTRELSPDGALQLLTILQREGRFIDFVCEDMKAFSDAEIGAAARVVHEGCKRALDEHFTIAPVRTDEEGARVTLEKGFDAAAVRLVGNVSGEAPFKGVLKHRGWRATETRLPELVKGHDARVLAPAEVEL